MIRRLASLAVTCLITTSAFSSPFLTKISQMPSLQTPKIKAGPIGTIGTDLSGKWAGTCSNGQDLAMEIQSNDHEILIGTVDLQFNQFTHISTASADVDWNANIRIYWLNNSVLAGDNVDVITTFRNEPLLTTMDHFQLSINSSGQLLYTDAYREYKGPMETANKTNDCLLFKKPW